MLWQSLRPRSCEYSLESQSQLNRKIFREVRRRTRPMGVMAHTESLQRIVFALFHHLNTNWSLNPIKNLHTSLDASFVV